MFPADAGIAPKRYGSCPGAASKPRQILVPKCVSGPVGDGGDAGHLVLCKPGRLCYTLPLANICFAYSSVAQRESLRLLIEWSLVRIQPGEPQGGFCRTRVYAVSAGPGRECPFSRAATSPPR